MLQTIKSAPTKPPRIIVYGDHKIGKSTFGASCPRPVFLQTEDGIESLGVDALPLCRTLDDVFAQLNSILNEEHNFKTPVLS